MRRRLLLAVVGSVAIALLLAGLFSLVLVRRAEREDTRRRLVVQAESIAAQASDRAAFRVLAAAGRALRVEGISRVVFLPNGTVDGQLPAGITRADLDVDRLAAGTTVSGTRGRLVYAAARVVPPAGAGAVLRRSVTAVILTRPVDTPLGRSVVWFALATLVSLVIGVAVADWLAGRITRPLRDAEAATRRIAAGDLDARVPAIGDRDELASLGQSINAMAEALARSRGLERQFLLSVSHDLRTPLTSIRGFAEAIADGAAPDHEKAAQVIAAESRRLERLVADLLELAKLDARRFSLDLRPTDVAEVVAVTAEGFRPDLEDLGIALAVTTDGGANAVADPDRLAQIVANLVENAGRFAASRVDVTARAVDASVEIAVRDDGPGIAPADLPHVFERHFSTVRAPARNGTSGSGLGLAIVAELCAAMGGQVTAQSGAGTAMIVRLPRAPDGAR